jgi:nucleotide-binding universal stress UspA family protein
VNTIVVGVDGSKGAHKALRVAVREAKEERATLRVVTAWHVPGHAYGGLGFATPGDVHQAFEQQAKDTLEAALVDLGEDGRGAAIETIVREGRTATVLVEEAKDADLLVVGSRGLGGFAGLLLGSVSQECAHQAPCSILIVRNGNGEA